MNLITKFVFELMLLFMPFSTPHAYFTAKTKQYPKKAYDVVYVTMYTIDPKQTDETPTVTASGFVVDSLNPRKHRIIAVSHDLKKKFKWGQKVRVSGIGKWSGIYTVKDLMHKRWKKRIDILINPDDRAISFKSARIKAI